ncbi:MAG: putative membrane protein [Cyclobacteriaceae bacterium]|jgi:putative membrane protein
MKDSFLEQNPRYLAVIKWLSILIPVAVAILIFLPQRLEMGDWVKSLPTVNAIINSLTASLLVMALVMVKTENIEMHKRLMSAAFVLGAVFLLLYVTYHASVSSVKFGDVNGDGLVSEAELENIGSLRSWYLSLLLSHIGLSIVVVPLVLFSFYYSLTGQIAKHKKIVKLSYPIWLYVSVSGVIVYLLISPYYQ